MNKMPAGSKTKSSLTWIFAKASKLIKGNTPVEISGSIENSSTLSRTEGKSILLRKFKIKTRLIVSFVLLLSVMLLITGLYSYSSSTKALSEKVKIDSLQVMGQTSVILNNEIKRMEDYFLDIGLNAAVQDALVKYAAADKFEQMEQSRILRSFLSIKFAASNDIAFCGIFHGNDFTQAETYNTASVSPDIQAISEKDLRRLQWSDMKVDSLNAGLTSFLGIQQNITSIRNSQTVLAKMVLIPKSNYLASAFENLDIGKEPGTEKAFPIFIIDNNGQILASRAMEEYPLGKTTEESTLIANNIIKSIEKNAKAAAAGLETGTLDMNMGGVSSLVTYSQVSKDKQWYVVSTVPYSYLNSAANKLGINIVIIGLICVAVAVLLCIVIARSVSMPLNRLVQVMARAREGDLTVQIRDNENDEIAEVCSNYNDMLLKINSLIANVRGSSQCVLGVANKISVSSKSTYSASEQVAVTVEQIAKGAADQADEINESVGNMDKLSEGITLVENDIAKVVTLANKIKNLGAAVAETTNVLNLKSIQVSDATNKASANIHELSRSMQEIQKILKIMNSISEQTNLLSLNATIEAARAGEAGKGFAVVANEVKKLAEKSKEFTGSISSIISSIEHKTQVTVEQVVSSNTAVNEQKDAVRDTEELFNSVFTHIETVLKDIACTEKSVSDIVKSKDKVLDAMGNISAVAEESAATTEQISASTQEQFAAAEELSNLSSQLENLSVALNHELDRFTTN